MTDKHLKIYYSIGEVSEMVGVDKPTLRFWEQKFPDIITPRKSSGNVRQYTKDDVEQIQKIYHLVKEKGMTLQGARQLLKDNIGMTDNRIEVITRLKSIRQELMDMRQELEESL